MTTRNRPVPEFRFPDDATLASRLGSALAPDPSRPVTLLERRPNAYASTFPSEVVTFRCGSAERTVFCKYGTAMGQDAYGHRHALDYEARVYREVLAPLAMGTPTLFASPAGNGVDDGRGTWLVMEPVENYMRLDKHPDTTAVTRAARWIGTFHARTHDLSGDPAFAFLQRYDDAYYRGWMDRTVRFSRAIGRASSWVDALAARFEVVCDLLRRPPITVIHGEYYPHNILVCGEAIRPIDWQSAALATGFIDLACQVDGWPHEPARRAVEAYATVLWPGGVPSDFQRRLDAAGCYVQLRWLGDRPEWTLEGGPRFDRLRDLADRLGLLAG